MFYLCECAGFLRSNRADIHRTRKMMCAKIFDSKMKVIQSLSLRWGAKGGRLVNKSTAGDAFPAANRNHQLDQNLRSEISICGFVKTRSLREYNFELVVHSAAAKLLLSGGGDLFRLVVSGWICEQCVTILVCTWRGFYRKVDLCLLLANL